MRLPSFLLRPLRRRIQRMMMDRAPDVVIRDLSGSDYLLRWYVIPRNRWFNIYAHEFARSDEDRALHSHPWAWNASILLAGSYLEHLPRHRLAHRGEGSVTLRAGRAWHRVELYGAKKAPSRCHTLFLTGPTIREWGFDCPQGFVPHYRFGQQGGCDPQDSPR